MVFLNPDGRLEVELLHPGVFLGAVAGDDEGVDVAFLSLVECGPGVLGVVAGRLSVAVVAAGVVEEHLALPRCGVAHVETTLQLGVETAVGVSAAPVLMHVEGENVLFAAELDESLLLVGQLDVLGIVPSVDDVAVVVCFLTCASENGVAVEDVLAGSIVVTASQIDGAGKEPVGREGAAHVDVGHDAAGCPLVGAAAAKRFIAAEGGSVLFPYDGYGVTVFVEDVEVLVVLFGTHVEARLKPFTAFGIGLGDTNNHVVVGIVCVPISVTLSGVVHPCPGLPFNVTVPIVRRQQNDIGSDGHQTVACACHHGEQRSSTK